MAIDTTLQFCWSNDTREFETSFEMQLQFTTVIISVGLLGMKSVM